MKKIISFLRNPTENRVNSYKLSGLLSTAFIYFAITFIYAAIVAIASHYGIVKPEMSRLNDLLASYKPLELIFIIISMAVIEELMFRLPLRRDKYTIVIWLFVSSFYFASKILASDFFTAEMLAWRLSISVISTLLIYFAASKFIFEIDYKYLFYTLAIVFGVLHLVNYTSRMPELSLFGSAFVVLYVVEKCVKGLVLGYIRVRHGLAYAMLLHILNNLPAIMAVYCLFN